MLPKALLTCVFLAAAVAPAAGQSGKSKPAAGAEKPGRLDQYGDPLPAGAVQRLGTARLLHAGGGVRHLAFDPDGALLASAGDDHVIRLWDAVTGQQVQAFSTERHAVESLAYAPDGKTLAAAANGSVHLWDIRSGKKLRQLEAPGPDADKLPQIHVVAFSANGKVLATGSSDGFLRLWDPAAGKLQKEWQGSVDWIKHIALSPDGKLLASLDKGGALRIWGLVSARELRRLPDSQAFLAFSPDSKLIATIDGGGQSCVLDVATGRQIETNNHGAMHLAFSADNRLAMAVNTIGLWYRPKGGEWTYRSDLYEEHERRWINCAAISPDGRLLATGGAYGRISIHDLEKDRPRGHRPGHQRPLTAIAFSPDGKHVFTGGEDDAIRAWDAATGKELRTLPAPSYGVTDLALSPDGTRIACVSKDATARLVDAASGRELWKIDWPISFAHQVAFTRDGRSVFANDHGTLRQFDSATGKELNKYDLRAHGGINCIAVAPDGKVIAYPTASWGSSPRFRELETEKEWPCVASTGKNREIDDVKHMLFSPDGKLLALGQGRGLIVVDMAERTIVWSREWIGGVTSLAFSRDGNLLAAGGWKDVRLFDVAAGKQVATFQADAQTTRALAFAPDGKRLAAASDDTSVLLWAIGR